jgi:hypothetical protein
MLKIGVRLWRMRIEFTNWALEVYQVCAQCGSPSAHEVSFDDEELTHCEDCQSIEGGYRYVNLKKFESA